MLDVYLMMIRIFKIKQLFLLFKSNKPEYILFMPHIWYLIKKNHG